MKDEHLDVGRTRKRGGLRSTPLILQVHFYKIDLNTLSNKLTKYISAYLKNDHSAQIYTFLIPVSLQLDGLNY